MLSKHVQTSHCLCIVAAVSETEKQVLLKNE